MTYSHIAESVVEQLLSSGYSEDDLEQINDEAKERGRTVSFICESCQPLAS